MDSFENPLKMDNILKPTKIGCIVLLIAVVTILHYSTVHGKLRKRVRDWRWPAAEKICSIWEVISRLQASMVRARPLF